jgi:membrane protein DedA with SNARE-associated domain
MFDWIISAVEDSGYLGILLLMFGENVFPPVPSELIMPLAGFLAAKGELNVFLVVLCGTLGTALGTLPWYYLGKWLGRDRLERWAAQHGRWLTIAPKEVDDAHRWFQLHGTKAVLIGRLIPAVRTLISIPAGIAEMPLTRFIAFTLLGSAIWTSFLTSVGYLLEDQYRLVGSYLNPMTSIIIALMLLYYFYRVATFRPGPAG